MSNLIILNKNESEPRVYKQIEIYRDINQRLKKLTKDEIAIKKELSEGYFRTHHEYIYDGKLLLTYDSRARSDIDREKLEKEYPEAFAACQKKIEYKQFSLK